MSSPVARPCVVLGFDYGARRIGIAVGQMITDTATPLATLDQRAGKPDWHGIAKLIDTWNPDALVLGLPGGPPQAASEVKARIRAFRHELEKRFGLPVHMADEAYTSVEAYHRIKSNRQAAQTPKRINKDEIDKVAAAILLEAWMSNARSRP
ncbi:MAG: Holliday junction resolvase RuvX [Gammaproteobacteria bacterium]